MTRPSMSLEMITLPELQKWTGITPFELLMHCIAILISTIMFTVKWYKIVQFSYWHIFGPMFLASGLDLYFVFIVALRVYVEEKQIRRSLATHLFNFLRASMFGLFLMFLCQKIEGDFEHGQVAIQTTYGVVFMPIWIMLAGLAGQMVRLI
ncbi:unnamed protein product [Bursaphelenchus xylophilus]|uniref:(pine wood nematode) hypothetical protein n=1 Tax=Bursaphelenchus xylophilus TaxID=6326 RepID=A0A1I7SRT7_BURXY|nr:unnamed protein product [Bursaphelenchus xylophilus]CAG9101862.1 unnamed protein product [Bursaphelenchus xylophilus]